MSKCVDGCVSVNNPVCVSLRVVCVHMPIGAAVSVHATLVSTCACGHTYVQMCMGTYKYVCMCNFMYVSMYSGCSCACPICILQPIKCMVSHRHVQKHNRCISRYIAFAVWNETCSPPHEATDAEN